MSKTTIKSFVHQKTQYNIKTADSLSVIVKKDAKNMKRIAYVSGPITNVDGNNIPAFNAMAKELREEGYEVVNPVELDCGNSPVWHCCLRRDIVELMKCDTIVLLPGWSESKGAQLEHYIACELGMDIIYPRNWL